MIKCYDTNDHIDNLDEDGDVVIRPIITRFVSLIHQGLIPPKYLEPWMAEGGEFEGCYFGISVKVEDQTTNAALFHVVGEESIFLLKTFLSSFFEIYAERAKLAN